MKRFVFFFIFLFVTVITFAQVKALEDFMKSQPAIKSVEFIRGNRFFNGTYKIMIRQPLDHSDTTKGFFLQRVFVADKGIDNTVLLIDEGYAGDRAARAGFINELSPMLNSNQIFVEHRYFGESWPDSIDWSYVTVENVAEDHHAVVELFKKYYSGKWVNTGISKGGQTAVYHRKYFPNDVEVTIAYVGPLNFGVEDGRHEPFIRRVPGTPEQRKKMKDFQLTVLKNRDKIMPLLKDYVKEKNYTFRIPLDEVLDYSVLEYSFAFWQWGKNTDEIPTTNVSADSLFKHLIDVSDPSYFAIEEIEPIKTFFVQAAHQLGYYGYDTKPFKKYLSIRNAKGYLPHIFLSEEFAVKFEKKTGKEVKKFIRKTDAKILFIYGEFDPWSASGFEVPDKPNFVKIVKPGGSHSTRINNLRDEQKERVKRTLEEWLKQPINLN